MFFRKKLMINDKFTIKIVLLLYFNLVHLESIFIIFLTFFVLGKFIVIKIYCIAFFFFEVYVTNVLIIFIQSLKKF